MEDEPVFVAEASPRRSRGFLASLETLLLVVRDAVPALFRRVHNKVGKRKAGRSWGYEAA